MEWSVFWVVLAQVVIALLILTLPASLFVALVFGSFRRVPKDFTVDDLFQERKL